VLRALLEAMRPRQWTKNLFVLAGVVFGRRLHDPAAVANSMAAFALFCLLSSSVYLINDVADAEQDRQHPAKRARPVASGRLSPGAALTAAAALAAGSLALSLALPLAFTLTAAAYFALNLLYSFALKDVVILDVLAISIFFVLRAVAGAEAVGVEISHWLLICTLLLALFIALSKRRHELVLLEQNASAHRESLTEYTPYLLDQMIAVVTASVVMAYTLYTVDERTVAEFGTRWLLVTIPFVMFGVFRYLYLIHQRGEGGDPDRIILSDRPFLINLLLWTATAGAVIYLLQRLPWGGRP